MARIYSENITKSKKSLSQLVTKGLFKLKLTNYYFIYYSNKFNG